jgi:hypothetical protein
MAHYSKELFDTICERLAAGESVASICRSEGMPERKSFYQWVRRDPEAKQAYLEACALRSLVYAEQIMDIVENLSDEPTSAQVNKARLQVDSIKWVSSRLQPRIYGDQRAEAGADNEVPLSREQVEDSLISIAAALGMKVVPINPTSAK